MQLSQGLHVIWLHVSGQCKALDLKEGETDGAYAPHFEDWDGSNHQIITWHCNTSTPTVHMEFGDTTQPKNFGICLLPSTLHLMAQGSITLWSPCINSDKNLVNVLLPFIVSCILSRINWQFLDLSSRHHLRLNLSVDIGIEYSCINS